MKNYLIISLLTVLCSCKTQKIPNDFENNTVYRLIDERVLEKKYVKELKIEKKYIPITASFFVYRNYDTFYLFSKDGKMKLVTLPKKQKNTIEEILSTKGSEGIYFETKNKKLLQYKQNDLAQKRIINKKASYQFKKDTLLITFDDYSYQYNKMQQQLIKYEK